MAREADGTWYRRRARGETRRRVSLPDPQRRHGALPDRPLRPRGHDLRGQRHRGRSSARLARRRVRDGGLERGGDLRDARRHLPPARRGDRRDLRRCDREARASEAARGERGADHAGDGVRRRRLLGLQPRAHLRRRERLRRPRGLQGLHRGRAPERDRGDPRRRLQPFRPERPRPLAVRRLERERQGRDLLLQRLAQRHALGRHPPRLRTQRGPPVHPGQRALLAGRIPSRRAALRHDPLHPQRARRRGRRRRRARGGLEPAAVDQC